MAIEIASWFLLVSGSIFCVIGGIGLRRMPDFYTRTHAASITDTLGAGQVLVGLMLQEGLTLVTVKLIMVGVLLFLTSPTAAHALVKAAAAHGVRFDGAPGGVSEAADERAGDD